MRYILAGLCLFLAATTCLVWTEVSAGEKKKEVTLKGKVLCGKCELGETAECATAIQVKEKDKSVVYYFDKAGHGKYHDDICTAPKNGTVTGVVSKDGKKNVVTVKSVKYE